MERFFFTGCVVLAMGARARARPERGGVGGPFLFVRPSVHSGSCERSKPGKSDQTWGIYRHICVGTDIALDIHKFAIDFDKDTGIEMDRGIDMGRDIGMDISIYMCIHIHVHVHVYLYAKASTYTYMYASACTCKCAYT